MSLPEERRRVLLITYEFPPSLAIGGQTCNQLARYLPLYDWDPVVLTVKERYFPRRDDSREPGFPGRIARTMVIPHPLDIYARIKSQFGFQRSFETDGQREAEWSGDGIGTIRRWMLSLLKTPDVYTGWILPAIVAGLGEIRRQRVIHLWSSAPYWSNHLIALILSQLTGLSWTAHFRDPWIGIPRWKPESIVSKRIETTLERMVVSRATSVVCVTDMHADLLRRAYPELPPEKFVTIPNGFDEAEWVDIARETADAGLAQSDTFIIRYAGSLYQRRNPLPVFQALRKLLDARLVARESIIVDLIGWCDVAEGHQVKVMAEECRIADRITFSGPLGRDETLRRTAQANLLLLLAEDQPYQIPGKTYEYLRAGRPILALTTEGALAQLLRRTGGAWVINPADEHAIVAAIRDAYGRWREGRNGPGMDRAVVNGFDRRVLAGKLAAVFDDASTRTPVRRMQPIQHFDGERSGGTR